MMRLIFVLLTLIGVYTFPALLLVNTFDESAYLFVSEQATPIVFKASLSSHLSFKEDIVGIYEPVEISVSYIPLPKDRFFITNSGYTIGEKGCHINIPTEILHRMLDVFGGSTRISVLVDRYPVEIFKDRVVIKDSISKDKLREFISFFIDQNLADRIVRIYSRPGSYDLVPTEESVDLAITFFHGIGGAVVPVFKEFPESFELEWSVNGENRKAVCAVLQIGKNTVDCLLARNPLRTEVYIEPLELVTVTKTIELGDNYSPSGYSLSGFLFSSNFVGKTTFVSFEPTRLIVEEIFITDTTPPKLDLQISELSNGMYKLSVMVLDFSAVTVKVYIDDNQLPFTSGVISLPNDLHLITVVAEDSFSNTSFCMKTVLKNREPYTEGMIKVSSNVIIDIGGFKFYSPYVKYWVGERGVRVLINGMEHVSAEN